jgi:hypothetical protein
MKWRVVLELVGADGTAAVREVSGGAAVAENTPRLIGLTLAEGTHMLAAVQRHLVEAQTKDHCRRRRRCQRCGMQRPLKDPRSRRLRTGLPYRLGVMLIVLVTAGCASIGPGTVPRDRLDYISAVGESWKEQTLLNVVRLRYGDAPSFVDVSSVISAYTFQGQVAVGGQFSSNVTATIPSSLATVGGGASYLDRPTITYTPLAGDKFARSLLRPLPPSEVFELVQSGYPADSVLLMTTRAVNGIYNRSGIGARTREADPEFYPVLDALRRLQLSGAVSIRLVKRGSDESGILILSSKRAEAVSQDLEFVRKVLGVTPDRNGEVAVNFGLLPHGPNELALLTRSMAEILLELAAGIEVPPEHVAQGRTSMATRLESAENARDRPLVRIRSSASAPAGPYAAVRYHDTWYWIEDGDLASKRIFSFLMIFFSLAETGVTPQAPVLTIPAN